VNITSTQINTATVTGNGGQCNAVDEAVTTAPCFLGDPSTNPKLLYPYSTGPHANARTNTFFNESGVLRKLEPSVVVASGTLRMWYGDEHAMLLGAKSVNGTSYPFTTFVATTPAGTPVAGSATNPDVGATEAQGGVDAFGRPLFPSLFCTDITNNANDTSGDWQQFGTGIGPDFVSGTWKSATISGGVITSGADPAQNHYVMGPGADTVPTGLVDEGYGTEVRWNVIGLKCNGVALQPKHIYRMQFIVHDGDHAGGDVGEACAIVVIP
jgi:hypothetical protein